jgi:hypothetical protein
LPLVSLLSLILDNNSVGDTGALSLRYRTSAGENYQISLSPN